MMKRKFTLLAAALLLPSMLLLNGCVAAIGNRDADRGHTTLGQQLMDLKKARDASAMSEPEYQTQKARLLRHK